LGAPSGVTAPHEAFQRGGGIDRAAVLPVQDGKSVELAAVAVVDVEGVVVTAVAGGVSVAAAAGVPSKAAIDKDRMPTRPGIPQKNHVFVVQCVQTLVTTPFSA